MPDQLVQWIEKLKQEQPYIIVEGPKDKTALNKLGLTNIIILRGKPLFQVVEDISKITDKVLILTDLDKKGRELYARLRQDLQKHGVKIDDKFREFLFKETKLRQIEGFTNYLNKQK